MASAADDTRRGGALPAPWAFLGFLVLGGIAVLVVPQIGDDLPHPGRDEQAQYATTCLMVLALTGVYVYLVGARRPTLDRAWIASTLVYAAGLTIVKFILSPTAFQKSQGASLAESVAAGLLVMPLYIAALVLMYLLAARERGEWSFSSRLGVAIGLAVAAVITRLIVAFILGTSSEYLDDLVGSGLVLPIVVTVASLATMESFHRAGPFLKDALNLGVALVLAHHLLWVLYMYRLF